MSSLHTALPSIAFIGAGNIGSALISGLIEAGVPLSHLRASCPSQTTRDHIQKRFGIETFENNVDCVAAADVIILAVKPRIVPLVAEEISSVVQTKKPLVISLASGTSTESLRTWLGKKSALIRAMPNTPAMAKEGLTILLETPDLSARDKNYAQQIFEAVGKTLWITAEKEMEMFTAITGSGPAYFFLLMELLQHSAIALGMHPEIAQEAIAQVALGSAKLAQHRNEDFAALRKGVTAPGGGTERALEVLFRHELGPKIDEAVRASYLRYLEMLEGK